MNKEEFLELLNDVINDEIDLDNNLDFKKLLGNKNG
jgi:hypothetical protein